MVNKRIFGAENMNLVKKPDAFRFFHSLLKHERFVLKAGNRAEVPFNCKFSIS